MCHSISCGGTAQNCSELAEAAITNGNVPDYGDGIRNDDQKLIVAKSDRLLLGLSAVRRKTY